jgi:SAM-dependent methyltransferase
MNKEQFYSRGDIVDRYEGRRFGGRSGRHVNQRELETVLGLLPAGGKLLDAPVGTGRLSLYLREHGFECHGIDYSPSMIEFAKSRGLEHVTRADLFAGPLPEGDFDCAVSLRFYFHFKDVRKALEHVYAALKPGGTYVLDTYSHSPRAWLPFLGDSGRVYLHQPDAFAALARGVGFEVRKQQPCYVFSPLIYRFLPFAVVQALDHVEPTLPKEWLARVFWQLRKPSQNG